VCERNKKELNTLDEADFVRDVLDSYPEPGVICTRNGQMKTDEEVRSESSAQYGNENRQGRLIGSSLREVGHPYLYSKNSHRM
jgi:hypothetical protein